MNKLNVILNIIYLLLVSVEAQTVGWCWLQVA